MGLQLSRYKNQGWRSQHDRAHRWLDRVWAIGARPAQPADAERDHDTIYAFFQNCYHLRDWLKNTKAVPQQNLDALFRTHVELRVCQDICNGTKHLDLSRAQLDGLSAIGREYALPDSRRARPRLTETWFVIAGGEKYDLFELAAKCMAIWDEFVRQHGLLETPV